jgi:hypothetical protein
VCRVAGLGRLVECRRLHETLDCQSSVVPAVRAPDERSRHRLGRALVGRPPGRVLLEYPQPAG